MILGILMCQPPMPERDVKYGTFADMFRSLLQRSGGAIDFKIFQTIRDEWPADLGECDAYLITGSFHGAYDQEPWISHLMDFIRSCNREKKKLVGVCFGHQVIAHALDGRTEKSTKGWGVGTHTFSVQRTFDWMVPPLGSVSLIYSHQDQVVKLPAEAVVIGGDGFCPYRMFVIGSHVLCMQGHPEFSMEYESMLLEFRKKLIPPDVIARAVASMQEKAADSETVGKWIRAFLNAQ